ncbi:MAG: amino acid permease [Saprospiraceae bacterium]|nr:amino acid permease [Saprospiraceae bacterium]
MKFEQNVAMQQYKGSRIGWTSATAIVVANMVGTGVFTSLGFQLEAIQNTWSILGLWIIGGLISMFGAFSYAEIGTRLPRSGGEYHFLSKMYHPFVGYLSGWVSLTVGFSAPIALAAMALAAYTATVVPTIHPRQMAVGVIVVLSVVHSFNIRSSSRFQNISTLFKLLLIIGIILLGICFPNPDNALIWDDSWQDEIWMPVYAVALVYVTYSYSGWNAAAYIVEEIRAPQRNLPRALILGTLVVSILYVLLQLAFLQQAPLDLLKGQVEIGHIAADHMFGPRGGKVISLFISLFLVSGISAMIWVGPRVTRAMAADYQIWRMLAKDNQAGIPIYAIWLQTLISVIMIITGSFQEVLLYSGFVLQIFTALTVAGLFILRRRQPEAKAYKSPFYPWIQIIYLVVSIWVLVYLLIDQPRESLLGLVNVGIGAVSYFWSLRYTRLSNS